MEKLAVDDTFVLATCEPCDVDDLLYNNALIQTLSFRDVSLRGCEGYILHKFRHLTLQCEAITHLVCKVKVLFEGSRLLQIELATLA